MTGRKNIKKLQILSKYRKRYHIYIQWQSRITRKNWDCQEIRIDQHNGYGLRVFRIIKAIKNWWIQSLRRQLPKDLIGRQTWQKNMRDNTLLSFCTMHVYLYRAFQRSWGRRLLNFIHWYKNLNFKTQQSTCQTILEINPRSKERLSYQVELSFLVEN